MSQEKVARYKEEKANRKAIMRKQKIIKIARNTVASVVLVALVGWLGYSGVTYYLATRPIPTVEVDYSALSDYEQSLSKEEKDDAKESTTEDAEKTDSEETAE